MTPRHGPGRPAGPRVPLTADQREGWSGPVFTAETVERTRAIGAALAPSCAPATCWC